MTLQIILLTFSAYKTPHILDLVTLQGQFHSSPLHLHVVMLELLGLTPPVTHMILGEIHG